MNFLFPFRKWNHNSGRDTNCVHRHTCKIETKKLPVNESKKEHWNRFCHFQIFFTLMWNHISHISSHIVHLKVSKKEHYNKFCHFPMENLYIFLKSFLPLCETCQKSHICCHIVHGILPISHINYKCYIPQINLLLSQSIWLISQGYFLCFIPVPSNVYIRFSYYL